MLKRICVGSVIDLDADEMAALHASHGDRLANRVAAVSCSWDFIIVFRVILLASRPRIA